MSDTTNMAESFAKRSSRPKIFSDTPNIAVLLGLAAGLMAGCAGSDGAASSVANQGSAGGGAGNEGFADAGGLEMVGAAGVTSSIGGSNGGGAAALGGSTGASGHGGTDSVGDGGASGAGASGAVAAVGGSSGSTSCSPGMVRIPSKDASFMMGLDSNEAPLQSNGQPWACYLGKHQVTFTYDYCVDTKLVTQGEFSTLMGFNPSQHKTADPTLPVDSETWYDAVLYCNKKSQKDSLEAAYSYGAVTMKGMSASNIANVAVDIKKNGYRLATNAEYEFAERAGTTGLYFFSPTKTANITDLGAAYAWYSVNSKGLSQPVGGLKPNPWGLYDIVGNLFEWENDWEGPYLTTPEVDPLGPSVGTGCGGFDIGIQKMAKGGSWHTDVATHMRISYHFKWAPASVHPELGFRCVATLN